MSAVFATLIAALSVPSGGARAGEVAVAVAANFLTTARQLADRFTARTGDAVVLSSGSSGNLYARILTGAPYDVFVSADTERPERLIEAGLALPDSLTVYARGRLVLWSADPGLIPPQGLAAIPDSAVRRLAIANPDLAPYGRAAREALQALGLYERYRARLVMGANIAQTFALVATGNAELGLVARAQLQSGPFRDKGSRWPVPEALHAPIAQAAVLLVRGQDNAAARAFLAFLGSEEARAVITAAGYEVE